MENPCLTFVTPSLIAGDKSLVNMIAHEISHSWAGNLVTMSTWTDFWLNEGFAMLLQRKIDTELYGTEVAKLSSQIGYFTLTEQILNFGESHDYTSLHPYLVGVNFDDAFSDIPYEKGYNFLYHIEQLINNEAQEDLFKIIIRTYFTEFKYKTITYIAFRTFIEEQLIKYFGENKALNITTAINWKNWIFDPGFPEIKNDFSNSLSDECDLYLTKLMNGDSMNGFDLVFKEWHEYQREYFLSTVIADPRSSMLKDEQYKVFSEMLYLGKGWNVNISGAFFNIMLINKKVDEESMAMLESFLATNGRMNFIRPLYSALAKINKRKAMEILNKNRNFYHPITLRLIEADLSKIIN